MSLSLEQVGAVLLALVILFAAGRLWYALVETAKDAVRLPLFPKREPGIPCRRMRAIPATVRPVLFDGGLFLRYNKTNKERRVLYENHHHHRPAVWQRRQGDRHPRGQGAGHSLL